MSKTDNNRPKGSEALEGATDQSDSRFEVSSNPTADSKGKGKFMPRLENRDENINRDVPTPAPASGAGDSAASRNTSAEASSSNSGGRGKARASPINDVDGLSDDSYTSERNRRPKPIPTPLWTQYTWQCEDCNEPHYVKWMHMLNKDHWGEILANGHPESSGHGGKGSSEPRSTLLWTEYWWDCEDCNEKHYDRIFHSDGGYADRLPRDPPGGWLKAFHPDHKEKEPAVPTNSGEADKLPRTDEKTGPAMPAMRPVRTYKFWTCPGCNETNQVLFEDGHPVQAEVSATEGFEGDIMNVPRTTQPLGPTPYFGGRERSYAALPAGHGNNSPFMPRGLGYGPGRARNLTRFARGTSNRLRPAGRGNGSASMSHGTFGPSTWPRPAVSFNEPTLTSHGSEQHHGSDHGWSDYDDLDWPWLLDFQV